MHDWVSPSMKERRKKKGMSQKKIQHFVIPSELLKLISKLRHTFWIANKDKAYTKVLYSEPQNSLCKKSFTNYIWQKETLPQGQAGWSSEQPDIVEGSLPVADSWEL